MIRFTCAGCKREFAVDNSMAGKSGNCSWCGKPLTIPQPYADGTKTDDTRDPNLLETEQQGGAGANDYRDIRLPSDSGDQGAGGRNPAATWIVIGLIILLLNVFLLPLTGYVIIPR